MKKVTFTGTLLVLAMLTLQSCQKGAVNNDTAEKKEVNTDSINTALLTAVKKENKVKDAVLTDANVLYIAVENDGSNRSGLASYFCDTAKEFKADISTVKIVQYGSMNSPEKDNAYGILLGENQCK